VSVALTGEIGRNVVVLSSGHQKRVGGHLVRTPFAVVSADREADLATIFRIIPDLLFALSRNTPCKGARRLPRPGIVILGQHGHSDRGRRIAQGTRTCLGQIRRIDGRRKEHHLRSLVDEA
jgi:hypothetical protein